MAPPRKPIAQRIEANTARRGECLIWSGSKTRDGYGVLSIGRRQFRAHRVSYEHYNGLIPDGMLVCHRCDTPLCVEPKHLFLGSAKANTADMHDKGRATRRTDTSHPATKVSHKQREVICARREAGETLTAIAADFGVSFQTISDICRGSRSYGRTKNT